MTKTIKEQLKQDFTKTNIWKLLRNKIILLLLANIFLIVIVGNLFLNSYENRKNDLLINKQENLLFNYTAVWNAYRLVSESFYKNIKISIATDTLEKEIIDEEYIKKELTQILPSNKKKEEVPNNENEFSVVNTKGKYAGGFSVSPEFTGFEYQFPLYIGDKYIGKAETQFTFNALRTEMEKIFPATYHFILNKNIVKNISSSTERVKYIQNELSGFYSLYYEEGIDNDGEIYQNANRLDSKTIWAINQKIKTSILLKLIDGNSFWLWTDLDGKGYTTIFIPIKDISGRHVGFIAAYYRDFSLADIKKEFITKISIVAILFLLSFAFTFYIYYSDKKLQKKNSYLRKVYHEIANKNKLIKKRRKELEVIIQSMGDGLFVLDRNKKIMIVNPVIEELSGYSAKELIGQPYSEYLKFIFEDSKKPNTKFIDTVFKKGVITNMKKHSLLIRKDKTTVSVADSAAPLKNEAGTVIGCIVILRNDQKEREIDTMKGDFISLASHQLRTPLTSMNWYTEILLEEDAGKLNKNQKEYLKSIYGGLQRMGQLVNNLLNTAHLESGKLTVKRQEVELKSFIKDLIKECNPITKEKKCLISLKVANSKSFITKTDPTLLRQVIYNLIVNAVMYSKKPHEDIIIKLKEKGAKYIISIENLGIGIPDKDQPNIFKRFFRSSNAINQETDGSGLGLYIAEKIIALLKGKIWFSSEPDKKTTFFISIPKKK